jgi:phosphatidylglycerophosphatase A
MKKGDKIITLFSTGFYTGYFPIAPATFSTLTLGIAVYLLISHLNIYLYGLITLILLFIAIWLSDKSEKIFNKKDCSHIVIDELVGFLITMFLLPFNWLYIVLGFFIFRFFDIVKPPPANFFNNRKKGGLDVVLDDVIAGIYSNLSLQVLHYWLLS